MIDLFQLRLKEIDDYVEKYLRAATNQQKTNWHVPP